MAKDVGDLAMTTGEESKEVAEKYQLLLGEIADKWTVLILSNICSNRGSRFNQIRREVGGISQKTLTQCLRKLERSGLIKRTVIQAAPLGVMYTLTDLGSTLHEPLSAMATWVDRYLAEVMKAQQGFDQELGKHSTGTPMD
ncbi:helix-turn-helix domain-containing protein (plasmid) [Isosphaeraceae bacterium EP7]